MRKRRAAFTLVELLIVMGIIVLFITMAIPSVRVLTGTRSISVAQNQLAAVLTRAREDAIALQDVRGVLFYIDPVSGRVGAVIVQRAAVPDTSHILFNTVLLDTLPGNDSLLLPVGVGLQTVMSGMNNNGTGYSGMTNAVHTLQVNQASEAQMSATQQDDRYLGFNTMNGATFVRGSSVPFFAGGCILFDGSGRLIVRPYGFQMTTFTAGGLAPSNLCKLMGVYGVDGSGNALTTWPFGITNPTYSLSPFISPPGNGSIVLMPGCPNSFNLSGLFPKVPLYSQIGLVLFDHDAFRSLGFTDADADLQSPAFGYTTPWPTSGSVAQGGGDGIHAEADEENWLDVNCTPIMVNRYNGSLIRGE